MHANQLLRNRCLLAGFFSVAWLLSSAQADVTKVEFTVEAGKFDRANVPVRVPVKVKVQDKSPSIVVTAPSGKQLAGQLCHPNLLAKGAAAEGGELCFILPSLKAGQTAAFTAIISSEPSDSSSITTESFQWKDTPGESNTLSFGARSVLKYQYKTYDTTTKDAREETFKVFHHVYDPTGKFLVTNGPGGFAPDHGKINFPHHRGVFYGFNKVTYDGNKAADIWHCTGDTHQSHAGFLQSDAGPVVGRHRLAIDWCGQKADPPFAKEERELTAYNVPGGTLLEFASRLTPTKGPVKLDGDPQHAGFHFRAHNDVNDKTAKQTYYLRPDGKGKLDETRNWPAQKEHVNLPWDCMSFVLNDQRFTIEYIDQPTNPKEARFTERDYGRFGSYFVKEVKPEEPLEVNYRLWLQAGEMSSEQAAALDSDLVEPVKVVVK